MFERKLSSRLFIFRRWGNKKKDALELKPFRFVLDLLMMALSNVRGFTGEGLALHYLPI